jgi:hypothetical protein
VDNFVDIPALRARKPCKQRLLLDCPPKKQSSNIFMNQQLAWAMGFVAGAIS